MPRIEILRPADPEPLIDTSTAEAAAEWKKQWDAGMWHMTAAQRMESDKLWDLYDEYDGDLDFGEWLETLTEVKGESK